MGEISQIEFAVSLDQQDWRVPLRSFGEVLLAAGCSRPVVEDWVAGFIWEEADDGFVYMDSQDLTLALVGEGVELLARPSLLGYTPKIYPVLRHNWLSLSLLFKTATLQEANGRDYRPACLPPIWAAMRLCATAFPTTPIFFTNEAQDGNPFKGMIEHDQEKLWMFDLTIVPSTLTSVYDAPPPGFVVFPAGEQLWIRSSWTVPFDVW